MLVAGNLTGYTANTYTELYAFIQESLYTLSISIINSIGISIRDYLHGYSNRSESTAI
jgi:hypothetical protein